MSKRHITNDFNSTTKRRRAHESTIILREPKIVAMDGDSSESLHNVKAPGTSSRKKPDADLRLSSRNTNSSVRGGVVSTPPGNKKNPINASPSTRRLHLVNHGIPAAAVHRPQRTNEVAHFCPSPFPCSSKRESQGSGILCGSRPASHHLSSRLFGSGVLTPSTTMRMLTPPRSPLVAQAASRMNDPTDLDRQFMLHSQGEHSLSALTSSYHSLLLFDAHRKSLDEELVRARRRVSHLLQERDFLLPPKDSTIASFSRASRPGDPPLLASHQQVYGAGGAYVPTRRHFLGRPSKGASLWLRGSTTADDNTAGLPQRSIAEPFPPFKEYQAMLQQALAAKSHGHTAGHRHHGFEAVPTSSSVESMLLGRQCSNVNSGSEKTSQPLERKNTTTCVELPEKALPWQTHTTSNKTIADCNRGSSSSITHLLPLPAGTDKNMCHFTERICIPLATDEDPNWLSEFLCFVRSDIVEVFRASEEDVKSRNTTKKVNHGQVGIRCRFCAHKPFTMRTKRSSSFPFTMSRIYQSLTMMLRDHFGDCSFVPDPIKERYLLLKGKTPQGASGSNQYWELSARKLGLTDSPLGIWVQESSDSQGKGIDGEKHLAKNLQPNKSRIQTMGCESKPSSVLGQQVPRLVQPDDQAFMSDFLYELLTQIQLVHLDESERIGNRKNLKAGMPGLGCRYCCQKNRKGLCRTFPARRRTLPVKLSDLFEHIRRCSLCPKEQRERLMILNRKNEELKKKESKAGDTAFLDCLWERMNAKTKAPTGS